MQCRRSRLPVVEAVVDLADVAVRPGLLVADRTGAAPGDLPAPGPTGWLVLVGPEGGFSESEAATLTGRPRLAVGPHVLRAETAAVAAAAVLGSQGKEIATDSEQLRADSGTLRAGRGGE